MTTRRLIDRARRLNELVLKAFKEKHPDQIFHTGGHVGHLHIATDWTKHSHSDPIEDLKKWAEMIRSAPPPDPYYTLLLYGGVYYKIEYERQDKFPDIDLDFDRGIFHMLDAIQKFGFGFKNINAATEMAMIRPNIERLLRRLSKHGKKRGRRQQNIQQKQQWRKQERLMRRQPRPGR